MSSIPENLVIEDLAAENLQWREAFIAERSVSTVKHELAVAAFDALRTSTKKIKYLQQDLERERIENARLREAILERAEAN